ncbi:MAG: FecR domain-containing protein, partial [bacterium]
FLPKNLVPTLSFAVVLIALGVFLLKPSESLGTYDGTLSVYYPLSHRWYETGRGDISADRLLRAEGEGVLLTLEDGSCIALSFGTYVEVSRTHVTLYRGKIMADVEPRPADRPFRVLTPTAEICVVGTRFSVTVE